MIPASDRRPGGAEKPLEGLWLRAQSVVNPD